MNPMGAAARRPRVMAGVRLTFYKVLMKKTPLIISLICLALAIVIFIFAEGARAVYSGLFFAMLAVVVFVTWWVRFRRRPE